MDTAHCISNQLWEGYAQKTLSPADMLTLQHHAAGCEMCADIKEGIDGLTNPETLPQTIAQLNTEVDEYLAPKRRKIGVWVYWSAAAVLLITLGIGWYTTPTQQQNTADNMHRPVDTFSTNSAPAVIINKDSAIALATPVVPKKQSGQENLNVPTVPQANNDDYKRVEGDNFNNIEDTKKNIESVYNDVTTADELFYKDAETKESAETEKVTNPAVQVPTPKINKKRDIYPSGILSNNMSNSYMNNVDIGSTNSNFGFNTVFQDSANYAAALLYFNESNFDSCTVVLEYIVGNEFSSYYQKAQLLLAKAFIKQKKPAEAKALLKGFVFSDEKLKKEANELLKSIK